MNFYAIFSTTLRALLLSFSGRYFLKIWHQIVQSLIYSTVENFDRPESLRKWQGQKDLNPRPTVLETVALPTELYPYTFENNKVLFPQKSSN